MQEIMFAGFTLHGISSGKLPFSPEETRFDTAAASTSSSFAVAAGERAASQAALAIESSLSRQVALPML